MGFLTENLGQISALGSAVSVSLNILALAISSGIVSWVISKFATWLKARKIIKASLIDTAARFAIDAVENWARHKKAAGKEITSDDKFAKARKILQEKTGIKADTEDAKHLIGAAVERAKRAANP